MRITEITQTNILNALGIPHSFQLSHFPSNPFISLYFKAFQGVSALRFASALANVNEEKEGEKEKISQFPISSHTARALCPASEIMREKKDRARKKKIRAENEEKRSTLRKKENTGNCPFENIGFYLVIPHPRKALKYKGFRGFRLKEQCFLTHI